MDNITLQALNTFQKNLKYLEEKHKPIFEKINLLNFLIEDGKYTERYALEYKVEGYFDILELSSNEFLYKENSLEHAKRMADIIDLKRTGAVFKAQPYVSETNERAELIDQSNLTFYTSLWATIKIINYVNTYATPSTHMKRVYKIIFLGVGLGLHLSGIINKLKPHVIFIKEKNLETFRLSLFVTDYKELSEQHLLYFSLTDEGNDERENFTAFLNKGNNYNLFMKHIPFTLDYAPDLQRLQTHVLSQSHINYGYHALLLRFIDSPRYLAQGYSFINLMRQHRDHQKTIFSEKPVLLVFSGPSTSKNIGWIQANRNRFILVCALSTCKLLYRADITPDIVIHVDPGELTALLFEGFDPKEYLKESTIILSSNVDEETVQRFDRSQVHFIEQATNYKKGFGNLSAPSVGEYTYALFLILNTTNLFMLGIDLALDNESLQTHSGDFHFGQTKGVLNQESAFLDPKVSIEFTRGNFIDQVPTLANYALSIEQVGIFTKSLKKSHQNVYNLSDGAYLQGCEPLHFNDYDWTNLEPLNRLDLHKEIGDFFHDIGSDNFNDEDKEYIRYQIKEAKKLEKIIAKYQKKKYQNTEAYLGALAKLSLDLNMQMDQSHSDLAQVYYQYFKTILSYVFDLFNTDELKNPPKHITALNEILVQQLYKMSTLYITKLESYLK